MARSAYQSDFVVHREPPPPPVELPDGAKPVSLPVAMLRSAEASARAVRIVYIATFIVLALLVLMCAIGPHIPAGE